MVDRLDHTYRCEQTKVDWFLLTWTALKNSFLHVFQKDKLHTTDFEWLIDRTPSTIFLSPTDWSALKFKYTNRICKYYDLSWTLDFKHLTLMNLKFNERNQFFAICTFTIKFLLDLLAKNESFSYEYHILLQEVDPNSKYCFSI